MNDPDVVWRFEVMAKPASLGLERPFVGFGYGRGHLRSALQKNYPGFANQRYIAHSHNLYTEIFAGTGLLGLGSLLWLLGSAMTWSLRNSGREGTSGQGALHVCLFASLVAFLISGLGDPFYHHETRIYFFTLLALIRVRFKPNGLS